MSIDHTTRDLAGSVIPVSWDAALALQDLGVEFFLLITGEHSIDVQLESTLTNFIRHHKLRLYVVRVSTSDQSDAASKLGVAYLPQVRLYRNGNEVGRHRGVATYELLEKLFTL